MKFKTFTGGVFETNCFLIEAPRGNILIDAPQGADSHFAGIPISLLLLTHGHFDHVVDAAAILERNGCPCGIHPDSLPLVSDAEAFKKYGFALEIRPIQPDLLLTEQKDRDFLGLKLDVFEVPGHCPGSLCFHQKEYAHIFGGDVLFRGGVGRWDLPGGDPELLFAGIRNKLFPLSPATVVHPGHGPDTTIGFERENNPYVTP